MPKLTINDVNLSGKRVFVRVDYNVPMEEKEGRMVVTDLTRVRETLPTLEALIGQGARLVLAAHLGRPKGKREPSMSLAPVAIELGNPWASLCVSSTTVWAKRSRQPLRN
jgi:phosphoglycerate kinase